MADVLYREGELVPAGMPVVSLLRAGQRARRAFSCREAASARSRSARTVSLRCDGCGARVAATSQLHRAEAEYTPPLIYSKENRAKLVFMVEARPAPADARTLHPGQPLEVRWPRRGGALMTTPTSSSTCTA